MMSMPAAKAPKLAWGRASPMNAIPLRMTNDPMTAATALTTIAASRARRMNSSDQGSRRRSIASAMADVGPISQAHQQEVALKRRVQKLLREHLLLAAEGDDPAVEQDRVVEVGGHGLQGAHRYLAVGLRRAAHQAEAAVAAHQHDVQDGHREAPVHLLRLRRVAETAARALRRAEQADFAAPGPAGVAPGLR